MYNFQYNTSKSFNNKLTNLCLPHISLRLNTLFVFERYFRSE